MRKVMLFLLFIVALFYIGCDSYDDTIIKEDIHDLKNRVSALEKQCREMNSNITSIQTLLNASTGEDYITGVIPVIENDVEIGYKITFKNEAPIVIYHGADGMNGEPGADGADAKAPEIGVKQDSNGSIYWTINGDWLLDDKGNKVSAVGSDGEDGAQGEPGITPMLKIANGYWYVSYDKGTTWSEIGAVDNGIDDKVPSQGSAFKSIDYTTSNEYVTITLVDEMVIKLPTWYAYEKLIVECNKMNTNIASLQELVQSLEKGEYITAVLPIMEDGLEVGYTISFSKSPSIAIYHGKDGEDSDDNNEDSDRIEYITPNIGIRLDADGVHYWTLDEEWLLDDKGNKVRAVALDGQDGEQGAPGPQGPQGVSGNTPKLKIDNGYWYVSYNNGNSWTKLDKATGGGSSCGITVTETTNSVIFTLASGTQLTFAKSAAPTPEVVMSEVFSEWPEYTNAPYYNFAEENAGVEWPEPQNNLKLGEYFNNTSDYEKGMVVSDRRWVFVGGPTRRSTVTLDAIEPMLEAFNYQFDYLREKMGWPPIATELDGYRNQIILHQSGLKGQGADTTAQGGWQSAFGGYPCVLLSYVPVQSFNPRYADSYQTGASIHEGIHAVFATLPGCKNAAWFHEGANTWLQAQLNIEMGIDNGDFTYDDLQTDGEFGWLCMGSIMAPFMPIECYSGWLTTDNSFGGPAAQGNNDGLCTRSLLGGSQYSSVFPTFMSVAMSKYSVAKIWQEGFSGYILDRIEDFIGEEQTRRMVMEYRARLCLTDMNEWTGAVRNMYNANWGTSVGPERAEYAGRQKTWKAYPYVATTVDEEGWYNPDEYTLPGWTGANIIPFKVSNDIVGFQFEEIYSGAPLYEGESNTAGVNLFRADGDTKFMVCWNGTDGTPYYTKAYEHGESVIIDMAGKQPANNVVFVLAVNTDYYYYGDNIRKAKYDFRVKPTCGIEKAADISKKWWDWSSNIM